MSARPLVVGAGCSLGCPPEELVDLARQTLDGLDAPVAAVATVDRRAAEPALLALATDLGVPLRTHPAEALAVIDVPTPSAQVLAHVGTPSVAEAAALLTAGAGARIVVAKRRSTHATCAIAEASP